MNTAYAGVAVLSRYGNRREFETMMATIDHIIDRDPTIAGLIVEIFCNRKLGAAYTIKARNTDGPCSAEFRAIADALDRAFTESTAGITGSPWIVSRVTSKATPTGLMTCSNHAPPPASAATTAPRGASVGA